LPAFVWSEEYQDVILSKHFEAFDQLREEGFFIGEMIWNFADFKTDRGSVVARALFAVWSHRSAAGSILATSDLAS
jgi:hypothetical protein